MLYSIFAQKHSMRLKENVRLLRYPCPQIRTRQTAPWKESRIKKDTCLIRLPRHRCPFRITHVAALSLFVDRHLDIFKSQTLVSRDTCSQNYDVRNPGQVLRIMNKVAKRHLYKFYNRNNRCAAAKMLRPERLRSMFPLFNVMLVEKTPFHSFYSNTASK